MAIVIDSRLVVGPSYHSMQVPQYRIVGCRMTARHRLSPLMSTCTAERLLVSGPVATLLTCDHRIFRRAKFAPAASIASGAGRGQGPEVGVSGATGQNAKCTGLCTTCESPSRNQFIPDEKSGGLVWSCRPSVFAAGDGTLDDYPPS